MLMDFFFYFLLSLEIPYLNNIKARDQKKNL